MCCIMVVREMDAGIIQNCGKYSRVAAPGCVCLMWPFESIVGTINN